MISLGQSYLPRLIKSIGGITSGLVKFPCCIPQKCLEKYSLANAGGVKVFGNRFFLPLKQFGVDDQRNVGCYSPFGGGSGAAIESNDVVIIGISSDLMFDEMCAGYFTFRNNQTK